MNWVATDGTLVTRDVYEPFDPGIQEFIHRHGFRVWSEWRGWDLRYINPHPGEINQKSCLFLTDPNENNELMVVAIDEARGLREEIPATPETIGEVLEKAWAIFQTAPRKTFA
jgi:hypothetical protein